MSSRQPEPFEVEPAVPFSAAVALLAAVLAGTLAAAWVVPMWLPGLIGSVLGPEPKVFWELSRTSALTSYLLFALSMILGLLITNRMARVWPGGPTALDLHQFTGLLGIGFALFHGLILLGDSYMRFSSWQILIPFATTSYRPVWVGLGQLAFYLLIPITFSFYFRRHISAKGWRALHYGTFIAFSFATVHGLLAGTDTTTPLFLLVYAGTGALVFFLTLARIFTMIPSRA